MGRRDSATLADVELAPTFPEAELADGETSARDENPSSPSQEFPGPMEPPPPETKALFCAACDRRFAPTKDSKVCASCVSRRKRPRGGATRCRVAGPGNVGAVGWLDDGRIKTLHAAGDVADFADADVLSLPDHLIPIE